MVLNFLAGENKMTKITILVNSMADKNTSSFTKKLVDKIGHSMASKNVAIGAEKSKGDYLSMMLKR